MSYERTWEENQIVKIYKWANGFTKTKMNKLQTILGNGYYWGMAYILCGGGLIIHFPLAFYLSFVLHNADYGMGISFGLYFIFGLLLEFYCSIQRDKITYNEMIDRESQLNFFRDFNIPLKKI